MTHRASTILSLTRRRFLAGALGAAATAGLIACGSDDPDEAATAGAGPTGGQFPVTVRHEHGETTIERAPERVVSYGYSDQDPILALGAVPVGILQWIPQWKRGIGPWAEAALGSAKPKIYSSQEIDFEGIAAARPDLIVAVSYDLDKIAYDKLSRLAPTVPTVSGYPAYGTPWDVATRQIGTALGRPQAAERLIARAKDGFAEARREHPDWAGKRVMIVSPAAGGKMSIFANTDTRGRFLAALGFEQPPGVSELTGKEFWAEISAERFDMLDGDALIVLAETAALRGDLERQATFQRLDVVRDGRMVLVGDLQLSMALSASTVTSIPYALQRVVPRLERALRA